MTIGLLPELDEVEGHPVNAPLEVRSEDYDLPVARALRAIQYDETLSHKVWLDGGMEEALALFDLPAAHKDILRTRDLKAVNELLAEEKRAAGVPEGHIIVWALVRVNDL